jgi:cytochrome c peroxidase
LTEGSTVLYQAGAEATGNRASRPGFVRPVRRERSVRVWALCYLRSIDAFQADRAPDRAYRTTPLRALWDSTKIHKGGFYHDGRFATLQDVVDHYNTFMKLGLTTAETRDLIEYLKSL